MLTIVYGVPGSGKSYYAVYRLYHLLKKNKNDDIVVISNIENLQLPHISFEKLLSDYGSLERLFDVENQFWKTEKKKVLVIDEAQRYFNKKFFSSNVFFFFQYHRHLNIDIYLITQSYKSLASELVYLSELFIQAVPSSFRLFSSSFRYVVRDLETYEIVERFSIPFLKEVADLYQTALFQEKKKFSLTYPQKMFFVSSAIFIFSVFLIFFFVSKMSTLHEKSEKSIQSVSEKSEKSIQSVSEKSEKSIQSVSEKSEKSIQSVSEKEYFDSVSKKIEALSSFETTLPFKPYRTYELSETKFREMFKSDVIYPVNHITILDDRGNARTIIIQEK